MTFTLPLQRGTEREIFDFFETFPVQLPPVKEANTGTTTVPLQVLGAITETGTDTETGTVTGENTLTEIITTTPTPADTGTVVETGDRIHSAATGNTAPSQ